jgi:hypothetical protein
MANTLHKFLRNRRAITPVLSNLLLTVVAVAAMALATTATYIITTDLRETMSERVIIEDVWFSDSTNIKIYLRNVGKVAIHVSGVYLNHTSQSFTRSFNLEIGQRSWLNISQNWVSGSLYYLDVVTTRGMHVGGYYKTP